MAEEILVELSQVNEKKPFFMTVKGIVILIAIAVIILAALFSWWLATGKISSSAARLDTMIYTVGSDFPARIKNVFVLAGDQVTKGQPLATVESPEYAGQLQSATEELAKLRSLAGLPQNGGNEKDSASLVEKEAASKLAQARFDEERLQKIYQEAANDHVRAQLIKRSINPARRSEYNEAQLNEERMALKKNEALENFEKASKLRATLDQALAKIKLAIMAARRHTGLAPIAQAQAGNGGENTFVGEATLSSPALGSVFRVSGQPGQIIQPGENVFYILPAQDNENGGRWIQAWFAPSERENIKVGQPVSIRFPDIELILSGRVEAIGENEESLPDTLLPDSHTTQLARPSGTYLQSLYVPVKIALDKPGETNDLEPGARAQCQIQTHAIFGSSLF